MGANFIKRISLAIVMIAVAVAANFARPTQYLSESHPRKTLDKEVPQKFNKWELAPSDDLMIIDPAQQDVLNYLYADLFNATYIDAGSRRVMLSIAYGKDQSEGHDVHRPDLCYPSQGFTLQEQQDWPVMLDAHRSIIVHYMKMQRGQRVEPLLYWTLAGDYVYQTKMQKRLIAFQYSRDNLIPDGMIIRVSMLDKDAEYARKTLTDFVVDWYTALPEQQRVRYFGQPES